MKYLKLILLVIVFTQSLSVLSQHEDTLGLKRLFWGVIPGIGFDTYGLNSDSPQVEVGGLQFEMGNYWSFKTKKRTTGFFRFTWNRIGIHNYGLLIAPAHIGLGFHVDYTNRRSIDFSFNAGLLAVTDDALDPDFEFTYAVYPQIRFNFGRFSIGLEYSYRKYQNNPINFFEGFQYVGIVLGGRAGKRIN